MPVTKATLMRRRLIAALRELVEANRVLSQELYFNEADDPEMTPHYERVNKAMGAAEALLVELT